MVKQNLGKLDRILRFLVAFWWLGPFAPAYGAEWANLATAIIGWIFLIESLIGWCALHDVFKIDNRKQ